MKIVLFVMCTMKRWFAIMDFGTHMNFNEEKKEDDEDKR